MDLVCFRIAVQEIIGKIGIKMPLQGAGQRVIIADDCGINVLALSMYKII